MPTLSSLLTRVRALLMDDAAQIWSDAALSEALRLALGEYNLRAPDPAALEGLDGAAATTLSATHETALVWGAAAYAALARAVDRAESFQAGGEFKDLNAWGEARLKEFKLILAALFPAAVSGGAPSAEAARLAGLRTTTNPAWGTWNDAESDPCTPAS